jgi:hypothetical protein
LYRVATDERERGSLRGGRGERSAAGDWGEKGGAGGRGVEPGALAHGKIPVDGRGEKCRGASTE